MRAAREHSTAQPRHCAVRHPAAARDSLCQPIKRHQPDVCPIADDLVITGAMLTRRSLTTIQIVCSTTTAWPAILSVTTPNADGSEYVSFPYVSVDSHCRVAAVCGPALLRVHDRVRCVGPLVTLLAMHTHPPSDMDGHGPMMIRLVSLHQSKQADVETSSFEISAIPLSLSFR